jgi:hypothetical protein
MFDPAKAEQIFEQIAQGKSARQAIADIGEDRNRFYAALREESSPLANQYARAMETRADWHAQRIEELADKVETDGIKPEAARVAIDARKWVASKLRPKVYGDRINVDADMRVSVTVNDPFAPLPATVLAQVALPHVAQEDPLSIRDTAAEGGVGGDGSRSVSMVPVSSHPQPHTVADPKVPVNSARISKVPVTSQHIPSQHVRISKRTGQPVRAYNRRGE